MDSKLDENIFLPNCKLFIFYWVVTLNHFVKVIACQVLKNLFTYALE